MEENKEATKQDDPNRPLQGYEYLDHTVIYTRCPNKFSTEFDRISLNNFIFLG